jgi:predicted RNase H-like HicB family nuclease
MEDAMTVGDMMHLGWTWQGPLEVREPGEDPYFEIRIRELPEFFVAGRTREEVLVASAGALRAFLQSYLDADTTPPLPANQQPSWLIGSAIISRAHVFPREPAPEGAIFTG